MFAAQQTKSASGQQQRAAAGESPNAPALPATSSSTDHRSSARKAIDETADALASPFDGIVSRADSEWLSHGVKLLFSLLLYGFGLSYLARMIHVRSSTTVGPRSAGPPATAPR